jgi:hypothetical protein
MVARAESALIINSCSVWLSVSNPFIDLTTSNLARPWYTSLLTLYPNHMATSLGSLLRENESHFRTSHHVHWFAHSQDAVPGDLTHKIGAGDTHWRQDGGMLLILR